MTITIKICGLSTPETLEAALAAGADMVGFVRFAKSPRHLSLAAAQSLGRQVGGRARKVLLTVDADEPALAAAIEALKPDLLQLHGNETPQRVAALKARFGLPVMKAIAIGTAADLARIAAYEPAADMLLLDSRAADSVLPGGSGKTFDWTLLGGLDLRKPWLLAGGLDAGNVGMALAATHAPGVDVSSGVESAPGVKDVAKISAFVAAARAAGEKLGSAAKSG
ncbi:MAG: phosphoribosylanthranilate isomerase [Methylovirgula sp.]